VFSLSSSKTAITFTWLRPSRWLSRDRKRCALRAKRVNKVGDASLTSIHCDCLLMDYSPNDRRRYKGPARRAEVAGVARTHFRAQLVPDWITRTCDDEQRAVPSADWSWFSAAAVELAVKSSTVTFSLCPGAMLKARTHCDRSISAPEMYPSSSRRMSNPDSWQASSLTSTTIQPFLPRIAFHVRFTYNKSNFNFNFNSQLLHTWLHTIIESYIWHIRRARSSTILIITYARLM